MKRLRSLQSIALFLIMLVLSLPFFSANTLASGISDATIVGTDGIESIARPSDMLFMNVVADLGGAEVTPEMLSLVSEKRGIRDMAREAHHGRLRLPRPVHEE